MVTATRQSYMLNKLQGFLGVFFLYIVHVRCIFYLYCCTFYRECQMCFLFISYILQRMSDVVFFYLYCCTFCREWQVYFLFILLYILQRMADVFFIYIVVHFTENGRCIFDLYCCTFYRELQMYFLFISLYILQRIADVFLFPRQRSCEGIQ